MHRLLALALVCGCSDGGGKKMKGAGDDTAGSTGPPVIDTDTDTETDTATDTGGEGTLVGSEVLRFKGAIPRNILMISIDTLRRDHLGAHGALGLTPFLDQIASQSMVMDDHLQCANWTALGTSCTLLGRQLIDVNHYPGFDDPFPAGTPFLATWLGAAGFYSIVVSTNEWMSALIGNTQGYDEEYVLDTPDPPLGDAWEKGYEALNEAQARGDTDGGWFLHLHVFEPHSPYNAGPPYNQGIEDLPPWPGDLSLYDIHYEWLSRYDDLTPQQQDLLEAHLRLMYAGDVRRLDARLERAWNTYLDAGLLEDTLVVIWTDHGEQFFEHGRQTHAFDLFGEESDGVLLFWADNLLPGRHEGPTAAIDLAPTLVELYAGEVPAVATGVPIGQAAPDRPILQMAGGRAGAVQAVIVPPYKLHFRWRTAEVRLYDRSVDPEELVDLYDPTDPTVLALWDVLRPTVEPFDDLLVNFDVNWPADLP